MLPENAAAEGVCLLPEKDAVPFERAGLPGARLNVRCQFYFLFKSKSKHTPSLKSNDYRTTVGYTGELNNPNPPFALQAESFLFTRMYPASPNTGP